MPCVDVPTPALPTLPPGLSIPALPAPPAVTVGACCQSVTLPAIPLPASLGVLTSSAIVVINQQLAALQAYIDALPVTCPRNG